MTITAAINDLHTTATAPVTDVTVEEARDVGLTDWQDGIRRSQSEFLDLMLITASHVNPDGYTGVELFDQYEDEWLDSEVASDFAFEKATSGNWSV